MSIPKYTTTWVDPDEYRSYREYLDILDSCKFYSKGKNGEFELRLLITRFKHDPNEDIFDLGFGVWDESRQLVHDSIETGNSDIGQILATVADKVLEFLNRFPGKGLYAEGSNSIRTRLYQREINKMIDELPAELSLHGLIWKDDAGFVEFEKGINFDGFLLTINDL